MTTEEMHNFNIDNKDTEIVTYFAYLVQSSIQIETAAKKKKIKKIKNKRGLRLGRTIRRDHQEQRYVIGGQG